MILLTSLLVIQLTGSLVEPLIHPSPTCCFDETSNTWIQHGEGLEKKCKKLKCNCGAWESGTPKASCCEFNGTLYETGEVVENICTQMICNHGMWIVNDRLYKDCDGCKIYLDPHIRTFDAPLSKSYQLQHPCNYTLVRPFSTSNGSASAPFKYEISAEFADCSMGRNVACNDKLTFKDNPHTVIEMSVDMTEDFKVKINGKNFPVVYSVRNAIIDKVTHPVLIWRHNGHCIRILGSQAFLIEFCGKHYYSVNIWTTNDKADKIGGLCGYYTNSFDDDMIGSDGNSYVFANVPDIGFSNSWLAEKQNKEECKSALPAFPLPSCSKENKATYAALCEGRRVAHNFGESKLPIEDINACTSDLCAMSNDTERNNWLKVVSADFKHELHIQRSAIDRPSKTNDDSTDSASNSRVSRKKGDTDCPYKDELSCPYITTTSTPTSASTTKKTRVGKMFRGRIFMNQVMKFGGKKTRRY